GGQHLTHTAAEQDYDGQNQNYRGQIEQPRRGPPGSAQTTDDFMTLGVSGFHCGKRLSGAALCFARILKVGTKGSWSHPLPFREILTVKSRVTRVGAIQLRKC